MYCEAPKAQGFLQYRKIMDKKSGSRYINEGMKVYSVQLTLQTRDTDAYVTLHTALLLAEQISAVEQ